MAETQTMRLVEVPLDRLKIADENVRKASPSEAGLRRLAASIRAHGLVEPLVVEPLTPAGEIREGDWLVNAGGRRLAAMRRLVAEGADGWERDKRVPCVELCGDAPALDSEVVSLAENSGREDLHPVDQAVAFRQLRDECGLTDNDLAVRFGVSPRTVQRRLRVASVAPELLAKARAGEIRLGMLEAAAVSDDHAAQLEAVRKHGDKWNADSEVRAALLAGKLLDHDDMVAFVGLEAYRKAGGATQPDLFARVDEVAWAEGYEPEHDDDETEILVDVKLLRKLAKEKLDAAAAAERRKGWPDVRGRFEEPHGWHGKYRSVSAAEPADLSDDEAERQALASASIVWLWVGYGGQLDRLRVVERAAFERETARAKRREAHEKAVAEAEASGSEPPPEPDPEPESDSLELPASLLADLRLMRADVQRRYLIDKPGLARDILLFTLCRTLYGERRHYDSGLSVSAGSVPRTALEALGAEHGFGVPDAVRTANALLGKREESLLGWMGPKPKPGSDEYHADREPAAEAARFQKLHAMQESDKAELLGCCVARMLEPVAASGYDAHQADRALAELGIDWHRAFNPGKPVLSRLTRAQLLAIADRLGESDRDAMGSLGGLKKAELLEAVSIGMASYRARERREPWLPTEVFGSPNGEDPGSGDGQG